MINDLYIVGDQSRLVVKNIINQFKDSGLEIKVFAPNDHDVDNLPNFSTHVLVLLSDDIEINTIYSSLFNTHR